MDKSHSGRLFAEFYDRQQRKLRAFEISEPDAVIEGSFHDDWRHSYIKLARLNIPDESTVLNAGDYRFRLYGRTEDFENFSPVEGIENRVAEIESIPFCEGLVLDYGGGGIGIGSFPQHIAKRVLESPRSICLNDGRIFLGRSFVDDESYKEMVLPKLLSAAHRVFRERYFIMPYQTAVEEQRNPPRT